MPGTIMAGNVRERNNGGGVFWEPRPEDVWAANAAAAALQIQRKIWLNKNE